MPDDFISTDAASVVFPRTDLQEAVKGDRHEQLEAIRDYIARELEANLCSSCRNSRLRTGDQAALILRLQTVLAELDGLPKQVEGTVSPLERARLSIAGRSTGTPAESSPGPAQQRRTGSRRPRGGGGVGA